MEPCKTLFLNKIKAEIHIEACGRGNVGFQCTIGNQETHEPATDCSKIEARCGND